MINYSEQHGRLPPAVVYGEDGEPLHSWRVLLLPYIDQQELYEEFKLDEPWDSPHNLALLPRMPATYALPPRQAAKLKLQPYHPICHVFHGPHAAFEGKQGLRWPGDFWDGTSQTILIIEAGQPVPWTKPEDLPYDPDKPLPDLSAPFKDIIRVAMADGSVRVIHRNLNEKVLRLAIGRDDGIPRTGDW
jgi:hypothetical protein